MWSTCALTGASSGKGVSGVAELAVERPPIENFLPLIRAKAQEVHREHVGYVELEDLVQEVAVWWLTTNAATLREYAYEPRQLRLRRAIWRVARDAAVKYRRQYGHDEAFVQLRYRAREVLDLLPVAMDPDGLPDGGGIKDGPRAHGNLAEGGDVLASLVDVRRGLARLHCRGPALPRPTCAPPAGTTP
jgi:hypothetical protein